MYVSLLLTVILSGDNHVDPQWSGLWSVCCQKLLTLWFPLASVSHGSHHASSAHSSSDRVGFSHSCLHQFVPVASGSLAETPGKKKKKGVWVGCKLSLFLWLTGAHQQQAGVAGVVKPKGELGIFCGFIILQKWKGRERGIRDRAMHWQGLFWRGLGCLRGNSENSEREFCAERN